MRLLSTDIDGTIFDQPDNGEVFSAFWKSLREGREEPVLAYNTGRSLPDTRALVARTSLPEPDYFICGVGTEIAGAAENGLMDEWHRELARDWDFALVREVVERLSPARPQPDAAQNPHKCSWYWEDAPRNLIDEILGAIESHGVKAQAIYSSNRDLDFLPVRANKGNAVAWLAARLGLGGADVVVAGDSGNDASMYEVPDVWGVIVANAEPALREAVTSRRVFQATRECAAGVEEGVSRLLANGGF